ncbi:MAG TPA: hypothetical protein VGK58_15000 [Lacipirellulaceae bacterium]
MDFGKSHAYLLQRYCLFFLSNMNMLPSLFPMLRPLTQPRRLAALLVTFVAVSALAAQDNSVERVALAPAKVQQPISLRDRLVVGLQARLKNEVAFVERVALRVRTGDLPQRIVDETFFWARARGRTLRNGRTRRPIIYFQPAMTARAKKLGVEI